MNINDLVQQKIKEIDCDKLFNEILEQQIEATIKKVLHDQLGNYSTLSRGFEKAVSEALDFDFDRLKLTEYSAFVRNQAVKVIEETMSEEQAKLIQKNLSRRLLPETKSFWEFDDFMEFIRDKLIEQAQEKADGDCCAEILVSYGCRAAQKDRFGTDYTYFEIFVDEDSHREAVLFVMNESCYHANGSTRNGFSQFFSNMAHVGATIRGIEEYSAKVTTEDLY